MKLLWIFEISVLLLHLVCFAQVWRIDKMVTRFGAAWGACYRFFLLGFIALVLKSVFVIWFEYERNNDWWILRSITCDGVLPTLAILLFLRGLVLHAKVTREFQKDLGTSRIGEIREITERLFPAD